MACVLAIDTANEGLALAVGDPAGTVAVATALYPVRNQAERLPSEVALLLRQAGMCWNDVTGLAVTLGPGGFSGVRVAAAYAQGAACARGIPVYGTSVHRVLAAGVRYHYNVAPAERVLVVQHAGRGGVYAQLFKVDADVHADAQALGALTETSLSALAQTYADAGVLGLMGNAASDLAALLTGCDVRVSYERRVDAEALLRLYPRLQSENEALVPLYVRAPDAAPARPIGT